MTGSNLRSRHLAAALLIAAGSSQGAWAQTAAPSAGQEADPSAAESVATAVSRTTESFIALRAGTEYSDNVRRVPSNGSSDTLARLGLAMDFERIGERLSLTGRANVDYLEYLDNTYDGTARGYLDAGADWGTQRNLLQWTLRDTFGQSLNNSTGTDTPDNLENVNFITTGPTLNLHFGLVTRLSLFGLYSKTMYENANLDSDRTTGGIELARELSKRSTVSIEASQDNNRFDDFGSARDFDTRRAYVRWAAEGFRTTLDVSAGYTELEQKNGGDKSSGPLYEVSIERRLASSSAIFLNAREEFSTASDLLRVQATTGSPTGSVDPLTTADPFRNRTARLGWRFDRPRMHLQFAGAWGQERYEQTISLDRTIKALEASVDRRITSTVGINVSARYERQKFDNVAASYNQTTLLADITKDLGRRLGLSLTLGRYDRSGSDLFSDFTENRIGLELRYTLYGTR